MKHVILSLAVVLVSSFAFAQTNSNGETENPVVPTTEVANFNGETENPVMPRIEVANFNGETENPVMPKIEGAVSTTDGAVSAFAPDEMIVLTTAGGTSASFAVSSTAKYQDIAGNDVDASSIAEGTMVQVTAEENGDQRMATRVVVEN